MSVAIALVISLCSNVNSAEIKKKMAELEAHNPGAKVSLKIDKKCLKEAKK